MMTTEELRQALQSKRDQSYKDFQSALLPTLDKDRMIGIRVPELRKIAKSLSEKDAFLRALPHAYYEEDLLHSILLSAIPDYETAICEVERFLPYIDNWAVCDTLLPKSFAQNKREILKKAYEWIASSHTYTCRFGIGVLMHHFLIEDFSVTHLERVAAVQSDEYYVNMMIAWYFATALAFQYEATLPFLENRVLSPFVHRKTIQKAVDSFRISDAKKEYLKTLRK